MPKKLMDLSGSLSKRKQLEEVANNKMEDPRVIERARILIACLDKQPLEKIAADFQVSRSMIFRWRSRFLKEGITGLLDRPRTGKPPRYDEEFEKQVLDALTLPPPQGMSHWDGQSLARALGASDDAVWRVLRRHGISLARQRIWSVKTRMHLSGGHARKVVGIYIAPPVWIMAQRTPYHPAQEAQVVSRNRTVGNALLRAAGKWGELALNQALQVAIDTPAKAIASSKKKEEIINFFNEMVENTLPHQQLSFLVLGKVTDLEISGWMAAHSQVKFSFFESLESAREILTRYYDSIGEEYSSLVRQMMDYPPSAPPFIWKTVFQNPENNEHAAEQFS